MWNQLWIGTVDESERAFEGARGNRVACARAIANERDLVDLRARARQLITGLVYGAWARLLPAVRAAALRHAALLKEQAYAPAVLWLDALAIVVAGLLSEAALSGNELHFSQALGNSILSAVVFCGMLRIEALSEPFQMSSMSERARVAVRAWCVAFGAAALLMALIAPHVSLYSEERVFFVLGGSLAVLSGAGVPIFMKYTLRRGALSAQNHIVIWPAGEERAERAVSELEWAFGPLLRKAPYSSAAALADWRGALGDLGARVRSMSSALGAGDIFVVAGGIDQSRLPDILAALHAIPRTVFVIPDEATLQYLGLRRSAIGALPMVEVRRNPRDLVQRRAKRMIDIALSLAGLILLSPLFVIIAVSIRLETPGPVFFRQSRTGYRGRIFRIFKFRTMRVLEDGPDLAQATKSDPRVTRVGGVLRRTSLDELPQLINVLAGDMSLVGPRPHALAHDRYYDQRISDYTLRQHVLPGITGWAQIHGLRGETLTVDDMRARIEHDLWYAANGRLRLDLWIMMRTCVEVFRCRNAY